MKRKKIVFVGISGGVDSATSAAILKRDGYDVTGVFIRIWSPEWTRCSMQKDRTDAIRVCAALNIPFREIDCTHDYKKEVIEPMIETYRVGGIPNPDVLCNRYIKFGAFFSYAMKEGADYVATGHYAQVHKEENIYTLVQAADQNKDQTYFLWTLHQRELEKTLFPIGHLQKKEVRVLAQKLHVPVAEKKDSQGLCFLGDWGVDEFLKQYIPQQKGVVRNESGTIIGSHPGIHTLTVGSRHGFTVHNNTTHTTPHYIVKKDVTTNTITVSPTPHEQKNNCIEIAQPHWITNTPAQKTSLTVRLHHRGALHPITLLIKDKKTFLIFEKEAPLISPGQSAVLYNNSVCLGGGVVQ